MITPFDPHAAEVLGQDTHLPPVPSERLLPDALRQRFQHPPVWTPDVEVERWAAPASPRAAAVLVPLIMREVPTVLLTQRTAHLKSHAGQISFPGGRHEPGDPSMVHTALREAHEEVGLHPDRVEVLGSLPTYTTGSGFVVTPVVGLLPPWPHDDVVHSLRGDPCEVEEIFEVPLPFLMNPAHHQRHAWVLPTGRLEFLSMPYAPHPDAPAYFIWGATAAMLRNLYRFLSA